MQRQDIAQFYCTLLLFTFSIIQHEKPTSTRKLQKWSILVPEREKGDVRGDRRELDFAGLEENGCTYAERIRKLQGGIVHTP